MDFVISLGLLECHAPPRRTQQKSTATPAAHPLGKHANLGPPSSPTVNDCRPSATLIEQPASVRSPAKCITCAIYARSPHGQARSRRGAADTLACQETRPPAVRHELRRLRALSPRASLPREPAAIRHHNLIIISSHPSPHIRHWHFPAKISFSPYTFPLRRIRLRADSTSRPGRLSSSSPAL